MKKTLLILIVLGGIIGLVGYGIHYVSGASSTTTPSTKKTVTHKSSNTSANTTAQVVKQNECAANTLSQLVLVSISKRHLWACDGSNILYSSAVVTGNMNLAADLTPAGTYHIYGMQTNRYLTGSDSTGSWHDYVHYWMPFLYNKYGAYGLHDATWRPANAFGNISPYSSNASHGCVELPLATAAWIYKWVHIGTTVTIES